MVGPRKRLLNYLRILRYSKVSQLVFFFLEYKFKYKYNIKIKINISFFNIIRRSSRSPDTTQHLLISCCCFAKDEKEMYKIKIKEL